MESCLKGYLVCAMVGVLAACQTPTASNQGTTSSKATTGTGQSASPSSRYGVDSVASKGGLPILRTGWIFWSVVLFIMSGIAFSARVAPLQKQLFELAQAGEFDWSRYRVLSKAWEWWGAFALLTPVVAAVLMVLKPTLPGL
jgi:uncharacterized membrane protein